MLHERPSLQPRGFGWCEELDTSENPFRPPLGANSIKDLVECSGATPVPSRQPATVEAASDFLDKAAGGARTRGIVHGVQSVHGIQPFGVHTLEDLYDQNSLTRL